MNFKFKQWLMALLLATVGSANCWAAADIVCGIPAGTSVDFTISPYVVGGTANYVGKTIPISCTRTGNGNNTVIMTVTVQIGNGASGVTQNTAAGSGTINYDFYTTPGNPCTNESHGSTNPITATIPVLGGPRTVNGATTTIYACVPPPSASAGGNYSDINVVVSIPPLGVKADNNGVADAQTSVTGVLNVRIDIPERCVISMPSGALAFTYLSFGAASTASKTYDVTCGSSLTPTPTMTLTDAGVTPLTSGTAAGLAYTLALNTSGNSTGGTSSLAVTSGGGLKTYRINGNMAAGQAGSCAAPAVQTGSTCNQTITGVHYLTVTW